MARDDELRIRDRLGKLGNLPLLRGVAVLNIKELANALKPVVLPGEAEFDSLAAGFAQHPGVRSVIVVEKGKASARSNARSAPGKRPRRAH